MASYTKLDTCTNKHSPYIAVAIGTDLAVEVFSGDDQ